jgi:hypothetical protein
MLTRCQVHVLRTSLSRWRNSTASARSMSLSINTAGSTLVLLHGGGSEMVAEFGGYIRANTAWMPSYGGRYRCGALSRQVDGMAARHITPFTSNSHAAIVGGFDHAFDLVGNVATADARGQGWFASASAGRSRAPRGRLRDPRRVGTLLRSATAAEVRTCCSHTWLVTPMTS